MSHRDSPATYVKRVTFVEAKCIDYWNYRQAYD